MKIVVALAWYKEPTAFLDRLVRSLDGVADRLVVLDGRWKLFDDENKHGHSPWEEEKTIMDAARAIDLPVHFGQPTVWESQVAKRDALMRLAARWGDWILVVDGDEWIERADREALQLALLSCSLDVAAVQHVRTTGTEAARMAGPIRRLYRASCGVTVENAHNGYRTSDGRWLHGDPTRVTLEPMLASTANHVLLHHEHQNRSESRNALRLDYRAARRAEGVEDWRR